MTHSPHLPDPQTSCCSCREAHHASAATTHTSTHCQDTPVPTTRNLPARAGCLRLGELMVRDWSGQTTWEAACQGKP